MTSCPALIPLAGSKYHRVAGVLICRGGLEKSPASRASLRRPSPLWAPFPSRFSSPGQGARARSQSNAPGSSAPANRKEKGRRPRAASLCTRLAGELPRARVLLFPRAVYADGTLGGRGVRFPVFELGTWVARACRVNGLTRELSFFFFFATPSADSELQFLPSSPLQDDSHDPLPLCFSCTLLEAVQRFRAHLPARMLSRFRFIFTVVIVEAVVCCAIQKNRPTLESG